jgi:dTDP-4-amino-4,6-dideoxygalactose transaminase
LHLYVIRLPQNKGKFNRREVFERLRTHGIGVNLHYIPIYRHPYYERMGYTPNDFPEAERYYAEAITLPMYPGLTTAQQLEVVQKLSTPIGHQTIF